MIKKLTFGIPLIVVLASLMILCLNDNSALLRVYASPGDVYGNDIANIPILFIGIIFLGVILCLALILAYNRF
jgi:heme/copper-type cytochrome/quinol oxidase subunit 2